MVNSDLDKLFERIARQRRASKFTFLYRRSIAGYNGVYAITHPQVIVRHYRSELRHIRQRVTRGWDDKAIWALDDWLTPKLIDIITGIREFEYGGTPVSADIGELDGIFGYKYITDEEATSIWHSVLDEMIEGFKADIEVCDALADHTPDETKNLIAKADNAWLLLAKWRNHLWT